MRISLVAAVLLAGCSDPYYQQQPAYPPSAQQQASQAQPGPASMQAPVAEPAPAGVGVVVAVAPPQPVVEEVSAPPFDGAVWCDGYWQWNGSTYVWVAGSWLAPPQAGFYWYPGGWVARPEGGYFYVNGRWAAPGWRHPHRFVYARPYYYRAPVYRAHWRGRWRYR